MLSYTTTAFVSEQKQMCMWDCVGHTGKNVLLYYKPTSMGEMQVYHFCQSAKFMQLKRQSNLSPAPSSQCLCIMHFEDHFLPQNTHCKNLFQEINQKTYINEVLLQKVYIEQGWKHGFGNHYMTFILFTVWNVNIRNIIYIILIRLLSRFSSPKIKKYMQHEK